MAIPCCDEARAACGTWAQLSSHTETEITNLVPSCPIQLSIICRTWCQRQKTLGPSAPFLYQYLYTMLCIFNYSCAYTPICIHKILSHQITFQVERKNILCIHSNNLWDMNSIIHLKRGVAPIACTKHIRPCKVNFLFVVGMQVNFTKLPDLSSPVSACTTVFTQPVLSGFTILASIYFGCLDAQLPVFGSLVISPLHSMYN